MMKIKTKHHQKKRRKHNIVVTQSNIKTNVVIGSDSYIYMSKIDSYTYTGRNVSIMNTTIGKFCSIARNVSIGTGDHPINFISTSPVFYSTNNPFGINLVDCDKYEELSAVTIGNDVWIGVNAVIKNGISIGNGAIIGANAVVTKNVPPYAIVVGIPAKIMKYRFDVQKINEIEASNWWDWDIAKIKQEIDEFIKPVE
jgi:acetyltransferase-like isoleucine patch superfamily enzyme